MLTTITAQDVTAVASLLTAVLALLATIWQGIISRDHNRKSTKPILTFHADYTEGARVMIRNDGVGPANITKMSYFIDKKERVDSSQFEKSLEVPDNLTFLWTQISPPATLGTEHTIVILVLSGAKTDEAVLSKLVSRVGFKIYYESVYGEKFETELYTAPRLAIKT